MTNLLDFRFISMVILFGFLQSTTASAIETLQTTNGVILSASCGLPEPDGTQHLRFSSSPSNRIFKGFGTNIQIPNITEIDQYIHDLNDLNFKFVKLDWGSPFSAFGGTAPPPYGSSFTEAYDFVLPKMQDFMTANKINFNAQLHANGIQVVKTMYGAPAAYVQQKTLPDGTVENVIDPKHIDDFGVFYSAYLASLNALGLTPDLVEIQNEPNGDWNVLYTPDQFSQLTNTLWSTSNANGVTTHLTAAATATKMSNAIDFLGALKVTPVWSHLEGLAIHTYYVIENPVNGGIPWADDPGFSNLVTMAQSIGSGVPLMSTEFGGTRQRTADQDPSKKNVDPAEEMKAALDLLRAGESMALVWNLYPNNRNGVWDRNWALFDENDRKTNAYWPFKAMAGSFAPGARIMDVTTDQVNPTMTTLGFSGFKTRQNYAIGLANPSDQPMSIAFAIGGNTDLTANRLSSFNNTSLINSTGAPLPQQVCSYPYRVTLPARTSVIVNLTRPSN
jgi:hypothetical protein